MLSACDAQLLERDPALPALRIMLDDEAMCEVLAQAWPALSIRSLSSCYVRYKPGESCIVGYSAEIDGINAFLYARAHRPEARAKLCKRREHECESHTALVDTLAMRLFRLPVDHELPAVALANDDRERLCKAALTDHPEWWSGDLCTIRYKPERRLVMRLDVADQTVARLKFHREDEFASILAREKTLSASLGLHAVRRVGRSRRHSVLAYEWLPGPTLEEDIRESVSLDALRAAATLTAQLHGVDHVASGADLPVIETLVDAGDVRAIAALHPAVADRAAALAKLVNRISLPVSRTVLHGDLSPDQFLFDGNAWRLIDFDRAALGPAEVDLGRMVANLKLQHADEAIREFLNAYHDACGGYDDHALARATSATLLRLAVEPFRTRQANWMAALESTLEMAEHIAAAGTIHSALT